jgi:GxxExxY protein
VDDGIRDPLTEAVIGAAIEVHRELGPGLLEEIYQRALEVELELRGLPFTAQEPLPVSYKGVYLGKGLNMDFVVRDELVIELKSVDALHPVHRPASDVHEAPQATQRASPELQRQAPQRRHPPLGLITAFPSVLLLCVLCVLCGELFGAEWCRKRTR